jgi:hypothetical protein
MSAASAIFFAQIPDHQQEISMSIPLRLSDLSPGRQALVRLCQQINFGSIESLEVRYCEPMFDPAPIVLRDLKLDSDEGSRPELAAADFCVSQEVIRLMGHLDGLQLGTIVGALRCEAACLDGFSWSRYRGRR